ncbi:hypothetical protein [Carboxylicivirga sp. M1479]|uniref:hypothetical protein n=1 Tax=Carboxylicivirga sp. M1479 TaxID=2594476 RepID=UPI001177CE60|nr:hypothetical protein [Carboxylicivirga sp. M1479]TRX61021.1 hypothetical protein FNN09_20525 [Carboxylicivirga sp. M1479]
MSNVDDYNAKLLEAKALSDDQVKKPYVPMGIFFQEAEDLAVWAKNDEAELSAAGLPAEVIDELPVLVGAASQSQSNWMKEVKTREQDEQAWVDLEPLAYDLRNELLHAFRYAFRDRSDLLSQVAEIDEGAGHADMIQDLNDLAVLGRDHLPTLATIGVSEEKVEQAAVMSDQARDVRARANGEKYSENENLTIRNKMYTLVKNAVDEIRMCGKFVFWRNKDRLKGYSSAYNRQRRRRYQSNEASEIN